MHLSVTHFRSQGLVSSVSTAVLKYFYRNRIKELDLNGFLVAECVLFFKLVGHTSDPLKWGSRGRDKNDSINRAVRFVQPFRVCESVMGFVLAVTFSFFNRPSAT